MVLFNTISWVICWLFFDEIDALFLDQCARIIHPVQVLWKYSLPIARYAHFNFCTFASCEWVKTSKHKKCQKLLPQTEFVACPHGRDEFSAKLKITISPKLSIHCVIMLWWDTSKQKTSFDLHINPYPNRIFKMMNHEMTYESPEEWILCLIPL